MVKITYAQSPTTPANPWLIVCAVVVCCGTFSAVSLASNSKQSVVAIQEHYEPYILVENKDVEIPIEYRELLCSAGNIDSIEHYKMVQHYDQNRTKSVGVRAKCYAWVTYSRYRAQYGRNNNYDTWKEKITWKESFVWWNDRGVKHDFSHNRSYRLITGVEE